jgi:NADH:ubiquinone oxidoreductase subunit 5 (subunit L)/multisubunit Na+/H+ antiporter MnhA subunit
MVLRAVWKVLTTGAAAHAAEFWSMPHAGFALRLYVDGLTAVFLLLAAVIAVPASLYSIAYMRHYTEYGVARFYPNFLLFLAAMYGLLSTTDMMWFFFIFWQFRVQEAGQRPCRQQIPAHDADRLRRHHGRGGNGRP